MEVSISLCDHVYNFSACCTGLPMSGLHVEATISAKQLELGMLESQKSSIERCCSQTASAGGFRALGFESVGSQ